MTFDEWWEYLESRDKKKTLAGLSIKDDMEHSQRIGRHRSKGPAGGKA